MRSTLVLGSGSSGVDAVAGCLVASGATVGPNPVGPSRRQPLGGARSAQLDALLESLLRPGAQPRPRTTAGRAWLAPRRPNRELSLNEAQRGALRALSEAPNSCLAHPGLAVAYGAIAPQLPPGTRRIVVFRDPATTVAALAQESARDPLERMWTASDHLDHWVRSYRSLLAAAEDQDEGEWLFVELHQLTGAAGLARLAEHVGAELAHGLDPLVPRADAAELPSGPQAEEARALLGELRRRAGSRAPAASAAGATAVAAIAFADPTTPATELEALRDRVRAQRHVASELIVVDTSWEGGLTLEGATVVHEPMPSRGAGLARAAAATEAELVALVDVATCDVPWRFAAAASAFEANPELLVATADLYVHAKRAYVDRAHPGAAGDVPPPWWWSTLVLRRETLASAPPTAFRRTELTLLTAARAVDRAAHLDAVHTDVSRDDFNAATDEARADAALLATDGQALDPDVRPALSVLCCSYQRRETLVRGMESFARQQLPPGTFELLLINDGSNDGTAELLDGLELPIPAQVIHRPNGKLAAARNSGLAVARGELTLLVNDDTIAFPDLVETHLRTHARLAGERVCVLGTFEQRPRALDNALLRYLEDSWEVFGYSKLEPQSYTDALHFYTCNVSAPTAALRDCGGYDRTFQHYGCEDTDVGVRLEERGFRVFYDDRARAYHDDRFGFEYLRRRQRLVGSAFVRLFARHPSVRARWEGEPESIEVAARELWDPDELRAAEEAAAALATVDLGSLRTLGDGETADRTLDALRALIPELHRQWWLAGTADGLRAMGLDSLGEIIANEGQPAELATGRPRRLLAWPRYGDPDSLARLFERARPAAVDERVALVLRYDPARDGDRTAVEARIGEAYAAAFPGGEAVEIELFDRPLDGRWDWLRLRRSIDATVVVGDEPQTMLAWTDTEQIDSPDAAEEWLATFGPALPPTQPLAALPTGPDLSVIVPTCNRPRELGQLLLALSVQDLAAERFEVIVVDDGSEVPAERIVAARPWPFAIRCLRQDQAGPGAARNRGVAAAHAPIVVFFNDDAVPLASCLSEHLAAQRRDRTPHAVLGGFPLLPRRRTDPFAELMERSTLLFAQTAMKSGALYHGLAFCTGNISIRKGLLERLGGFDAALPFAGAEDSELGLRMERELGLRVRYDAACAAAHDHALEVRGFARRQRVLGWSVAHIADKHALPTLIRPQLERADDAFWARLAESDAGSEGELERLVAAVEGAVAPVEDPQQRAARAEALRPHVERIRQLAFDQGLLRAHRGVSAADLHDPASPPMPRAQAG